jgi:RND family efflux transporter MFP subunit
MQRLKQVVRVALVMVTGAVLASCGTRKEQAPEQKKDVAVAVQSVEAVAAELPSTLILTGTLMPEQQSQVTSLVAGRVVQVFVERGAKVKNNQPLVRLRDVDFRSAAEAADAQVAQARARLGSALDEQGRLIPEKNSEVLAAKANQDLTEDALRRAQELAKTGSISDQDLIRAQAQAATAREQYNASISATKANYAMYKSAQAQRDQAQRAVADSIVRAPFSGEIAEKLVNIGEYVTPQKPLVLLVCTDPLRLEVQVPQNHIDRVQVGQVASVKVDAFPDRVFEAKVRYISAAVKSESRTLTVEGIVKNADGVLRPGMFASVQMDLGQKVAVVRVPVGAVVTDSGVSRAYVVVGDHVEERVLTVQNKSADFVDVLEGVKTGERVAVGDLRKLGDGTLVSVAPRAP